ncbi:MAG: diadenylate cyclase CdaA [Bacteroidetes bacterium]|nr:diadenylate cyclase CdaA [Bacteroidota bacterium]MCL2302416.1 diadenylate cyclase CdaA [Lentimicrobiaceae bacterium]
MNILDYLSENVTNIIDIILVIIIIILLFRWLRGTSATRIIVGLVLVYIGWKVVSIFHLTILSEILGQIIQVGVILLVIIFQPEIRKFLYIMGNRKFFKWFTRNNKEVYFEDDVDAIVRACQRMSAYRTGALIIIAKRNPLNEIITTGEPIDALVSRKLLENIFFKNSPLHDGAVVINKHRIVAASCILPVSKSDVLPTDIGLRHRSAVGITAETDATAVIVSEQTGQISVSIHGNLHRNISPTVLKQVLLGKIEL